MHAVDLSIVTFRPDLPLLRQLLQSLAAEAGDGLRLNLLVHDNTPETGSAEAIRAMPEASLTGFARVEVHASAQNVGFGRGHNANAARGEAPWLLVLNQDCVVEPGALASLVAGASGTVTPGPVSGWSGRCPTPGTARATASARQTTAKMVNTSARRSIS